jgi:zinc/manganese transport system substrate-binding protein
MLLMKIKQFLFLLLLPLLSFATESVHVVSFNPVITDLIRQVGADAVDVISMVEPGINPHQYRPSPGDYKKARDADLVVVAGKGLETWLPDLESAMRGEMPVLKVGDHIPSLRMVHHHDHHGEECHSHHHGTVDPHWWHSIRNMQRAADIMKDALIDVAPEQAQVFEANASDFQMRLEELYNWTRVELSRIPRARRKLTTAHAAFNYFCREFGFEAIHVQGLSTEQDPSPEHLREVINTLRSEHVIAVFPEIAANPKVMQNMVKEAGVVLGEPLLSGSPSAENPTYEAMIRHNVNAITDALANKDVE